MRAKAEQYSVKLSDAQMLDVLDQHQKLTDSEENKAFAEEKVRVQSMKQEMEIKMAKIQIEEEDFKKQKDFFDAKISKHQRIKKDQELDKAKFEYGFDNIKVEMDQIEKIMFLKKRFCIQRQQIEELKRRKKQNEEDYAGKLKRQQDADKWAGIVK